MTNDSLQEHILAVVTSIAGLVVAFAPSWSSNVQTALAALAVLAPLTINFVRQQSRGRVVAAASTPVVPPPTPVVVAVPTAPTPLASLQPPDETPEAPVEDVLNAPPVKEVGNVPDLSPFAAPTYPGASASEPPPVVQ